MHVYMYNWNLTNDPRFFVLWHVQGVKNHYAGEEVEAGAPLKITFSGDEINLDIPDVGINLPSGWSLKPLQSSMASY